MSDLFSSVNINSSFQRSARIDNKISSEFLDHFVFHDTSKKVLSLFTSPHFKSANTVYNILGADVINEVIAKVFGQKVEKQENLESEEEAKN